METTPIKAYTRKELLSMYGVSRTTFWRWLNPFNNEIGDIRGKVFTPKQVKIIFEKLGFPLS